DLGRRHALPTYEDLGSGYLTRTESITLTDEPAAIDSIRAGVDIVSFSGDKLLGGPQAGIIAGKKSNIDRIRQNPLFAAWRVDKLTIAILEYVLNAYLRGDVDAIPIWKMLRATEADLKARVDAFVPHVGSIAEPIAVKSVVGGGSAPEAYIPSWGIALRHAAISATELETRLRKSDPPVIARIENECVVLDFRTISKTEEEELARVL